MVVDHHEGPGGWDMKRAMKFFLLACASVGVAAACTPPTTGTPGGGTTDTIAPQVISVDVIPNEVQPGQQFTISATVTDAVGVTSVAFVVRANNLQAKPEQLQAHLEEMAQSYEKPAEVVRWYLSDRNRMAEVEGVVVENNVAQFVLERAQVTEKPLPFDELMAS